VSPLLDKRVSQISADEMLKRFGGPYFGFAVVDLEDDIREAYVLNSLPVSAKRFVAAHEIYHLDFNNVVNNHFLHELSATLAGLRVAPIGGLIVIFKTITSVERIKLYTKRFNQ